LDFSRRHEPSLYQLFGGSASTSKATESLQIGDESIESRSRGPMLRLKLFWDLISAPGERKASDIFGRDEYSRPRVGRHLRELAKNGIITYESARPDQPYSYYKLVENGPTEKPPPHSTFKSLTADTYNAFKESDDWITVGDIARNLKYGHEMNLTSVISHLKRLGYVESQKFRYDLKSKLSLSRDQETVLFDLMDSIARFQEQDAVTLQRGYDAAQQIVSSPDQASALMIKAKDHSPYALKMTPGELGDVVMTVISGNAGLNALEIRAEVEKEISKEIGVDSIRRALKALQESGVVFQQKEKGNTSSWFIKAVVN
jgi:DNA-binding transcriptional ArsR family regulator